MGRTIHKGAAVGVDHVSQLPRESRSPAAGEGKTATYSIEMIGPDMGLLKLAAPMGQLNHYVHLLRKTEEPTPPAGLIESHDGEPLAA